MQRDSLERFIGENREAFEDAVPSLAVWARIDQQMSRRQSRRMTVWRGIRIAAAVAALLFIGAAAGQYLANTNAGKAPVAALEEMSPEYAEMARYYESRIDQHVQQLVNHQQGATVFEDLEQLDAAMEELRQELLTAPAGKEEQIIENLIRSYQTKVNILERVLERTQKAPMDDRQFLNSTSNEVSI